MSTLGRAFPGACVAAMMLSSAAPAHAYLDPGAGSMLLQLVLGGVAGVGVALKLYWRRLKAMVGRSSDDATTGAMGNRERD